MSDFLAMGGHGVYVWTAYGLSLLALIAVGAWPLLGMRTLVRGLKRRSQVGAAVASGEAESK
ncbi:MAG: heme exporter protein CcmD [Gammaproteobacteria bacterium]|nr:heme exporter protein CcmD [Gammaproteobacteria bacterium]